MEANVSNAISLRVWSKDVTTVALTAHAMVEVQAEILRASMNKILPKPLSHNTPRGLLENVASALGDDTAIDHAHLTETRDALDRQTFVTLLTQFMAEVDAFQNGFIRKTRMQPKTTVPTPTKTAGSASVFGAVQLCDVARKIEPTAKAGNNTTNAAIAKFCKIWQTIKATLSTPS